MHSKISKTVAKVLNTFNVEVKANIPMDRNILANMLTMELYKELAIPAKSSPQKPEAPLGITLPGDAAR